MNSRIVQSLMALACLAFATTVSAQAATPETVLLNGTLDNTCTQAQTIQLQFVDFCHAFTNEEFSTNFCLTVPAGINAFCQPLTFSLPCCQCGQPQIAELAACPCFCSVQTVCDLLFVAGGAQTQEGKFTLSLPLVGPTVTSVGTIDVTLANQTVAPELQTS